LPLDWRCNFDKHHLYDYFPINDTFIINLTNRLTNTTCQLLRMSVKCTVTQIPDVKQKVQNLNGVTSIEQITTPDGIIL